MKIKNIIYALIESTIRNVAGGLGQRIRLIYYSKRLKACGINVKISEGVIIENPQNIEIGNDVWILPYSILTGPSDIPIPKERLIFNTDNQQIKDFEKKPMKIGDQCSIGAYNIIHGYGGIIIGEKVTTSARVSIYSFSHLPYAPTSRDVVTYANAMVKNSPIACIVSPINIADGAWLGLGVTVFAGEIEENSFVTANSVVIGNVDANSIYAGNPAKYLRPRFEQ